MKERLRRDDGATTYLALAKQAEARLKQRGAVGGTRADPTSIDRLERGTSSIQSGSPVPTGSCESSPTGVTRSPGSRGVALTCFVCRGHRFWRSVHGPTICARCHPPADERLVAAWVVENAP